MLFSKFILFFFSLIALLALNLNSGRKIWSVSVGSNSTPLIVGGSIFVVSTKGQLVRIGENNGEVIWSRNISGSNTSNEKFFAGGDMIMGSSLAVYAIAHGRDAAKEIINYLKSN